MVLSSSSAQQLFDYTANVQCPHCSRHSALTLMTIPDYGSLIRYRPTSIGMVYQCNGCQEPIFLKFIVDNYDSRAGIVRISDHFQEVETVQQTFDYEYLPPVVEDNFREALGCYSVNAFNGFAAMCRRTIQSAASELGAKGKDKVMRQIEDLKEMSQIDEGTYEVLKKIILDGHDGAHPHLPALSSERAEVLLELIKDVMYQLFVRKGKLNKAASLRVKEIAKQKETL